MKLVDTLNPDRLVAALMAWIKATQMLTDEGLEAIEQSVRAGLKREDETIMEMAAAMTAALSAYLGATTNLDMETSVREIIARVAESNRAKSFEMAILHGPGLGKWEMIIRRYRPNQAPISPIILPRGNG